MWDQEELSNIIQEDDLHVAPLRKETQVCGTPTWIWCVQSHGELYIRAYNGTGSRWYQSALSQCEGRIFACGKGYEVSFTPIKDAQINADVDEAYREKYKQSSYLSSMISERARAATMKVTLRD